MKTKEILTICPSYGRPQRLTKMIESFLETSCRSDLSVWVNADDPCFSDYYKIRNWYFKIGAPVMFCCVSTTMTITQMFNSAANLEGYSFYHQTNDDFIYKTIGWDAKFINKLSEFGEGIVYGNDLVQGKNLPTAQFISAGIIRALGWIQLPSLTHLGNDCVWKEIGSRIKRLFYMEDVIIEHQHWMKNKSLIDTVYQRTNSQQMYDKDQRVYRQWFHQQMDKDVERIKSLCKI